jgi:rhamnose utilization protein RhaD (predicted bifunctional aldolase and dehydrogenase)
MRMEIEQGLRPSLLNFGGYKNIDYSSTKDARKSAVFEGLEKLGYSSFAFSDSKNILRLVSSKKGESYATRGNIAPEQVLYLGLRPLWVSYNGDPKEELNVLERGIKLYITRFGSEPRTIYFEGLGVVAVGRSEAEGTLIIRVAEKLADVLGRTLAFDGPRYLTKKQEEAILAT